MGLHDGEYQEQPGNPFLGAVLIPGGPFVAVELVRFAQNRLQLAGATAELVGSGRR